MIGLDTNIVVRYLTQDDERQSALANQLIDERMSAGRPGYVSLVVLAEVIWVMTSLYSATRQQVIGIVAGLLSAQQVRIEKPESVGAALRAFAGSKADFSDALIAELARLAGAEYTATFDRHAAHHPGFRLLS